MKDEIFTTVKLPTGETATVFEGKGKHYFSALVKSKGDTSLMIKYLMMEIVQIEGKKLSEEQLDEMHLRDVNYLSTVIATMMSNDFSSL